MISVTISCYKSNKEYLKEAIKSILNQTYKDIELLVKDDGGLDFKLKDFLETFNDKRIKYLSGGHLGFCGSSNYLIEHSKGDYVAIHDHDDISAPNRLELCLKEFEKDNTLTTVSGRIFMFGKCREREDGEEMPPERVTEELLFFQPIKHGTVLLNKEHFIKNNIKFDTLCGAAADFELWSRIRHLRHKIIKPILLKYRKHDTNFTTDKKSFRTWHASIIQRNLLLLDIKLPIETCKMLDPYNHEKQPAIFLNYFISSQDKLLKHISFELFTRKITEMSKKCLL